MKSLEEVLETLAIPLNRQIIEEYIARHWLRPIVSRKGWYFEEIDIARLELICYLSREINVNDDGMDIVLSLLDQLYGLRAHMHRLNHAMVQELTTITH